MYPGTPSSWKQAWLVTRGSEQKASVPASPTTARLSFAEQRHILLPVTVNSGRSIGFLSLPFHITDGPSPAGIIALQLRYGNDGF